MTESRWAGDELRELRFAVTHEIEEGVRAGKPAASLAHAAIDVFAAFLVSEFEQLLEARVEELELARVEMLAARERYVGLETEMEKAVRGEVMIQYEELIARGGAWTVLEEARAKIELDVALKGVAAAARDKA